MLVAGWPSCVEDEREIVGVDMLRLKAECAARSFVVVSVGRHIGNAYTCQHKLG